MAEPKTGTGSDQTIVWAPDDQFTKDLEEYLKNQSPPCPRKRTKHTGIQSLLHKHSLPLKLVWHDIDSERQNECEDPQKNSQELIKEITSENEIYQKTQALLGLELHRIIAAQVKGGNPQNPLEEFAKEKDMDKWFTETVAPAIVKELKNFQDKLKQEGDVRVQKEKETQEGQEEAQQWKEKYSVRKYSLGPVDDYYKGIIGRIGFPRHDLRAAMEDEHCNSDDSKDEFLFSNYGGRTTPKDEYRAVVDRDEGAKLTAASKNHRKLRYYKDIMMTDQAKAAGLKEEEVIALQLYTGAMYTKYNCVLRGEPLDQLKALKGNKYVTTIFLVVSGIIKLSKTLKLPDTRYVWRGLSGVELPDQFIEKDQETNIRGGLERAMMSTTTKRDVAIRYATLDDKKIAMPVLFRIEIGAIDRGADLRFLSQYPEEDEILFPPASFLEVIGDVYFEKIKIDGGDKGKEIYAKVVPLRINANQTTKTIDDFLEQRRNLHTSMLEHFQSEIKRELQSKMESEDVKKRLQNDAFCLWNKHHETLKANILLEIDRTIQEHKEMANDSYNDHSDYSRKMKSALAIRSTPLLVFNHWLKNKTVQAHVINKLPMKKIEQAAMSLQLRELKQAKCEGKVDEARDFALEICKTRECLIREVDEVVNNLGQTPLIVASAKGYLNDMKLILEASGDKKKTIDYQAKDGTTALMTAAAAGWIDCCEFLVESKANIKMKDKEGETSLYAACDHGHWEVVAYLGSKDPSLIMEARNDGLTSLIIASKNGHERIVKYLLNKGGRELLMKRRISDNAGSLNMAAQNDHISVVKMLLKGNEKDLLSQSDKNGFTALYMACSNGQNKVVEDIVKMAKEFGILSDLLEKKVSPACHFRKKRGGWTCLHIACYNGQIEAVKLICSNCGEDLFDVEDQWGETCFGTACKKGHEEVVKFLFDKARPKDGGRGMLTRRRTKDNQTCLHLACRSGSKKVFSFLMEKGGDQVERLLVEPDKKGRSCFSIACKHGHTELVKFLLELYPEKFKDELKKNLKDGSTSCLHLACISGSQELCEYLLYMLSGVKKSDALCAVHNGKDKTENEKSEEEKQRRKVFHKLLMQKDTKGRTCMRIAVLKGHDVLVRRFYAEQESEVLSDKDERGATCFSTACEKGRKACAEFLYEKMVENEKLKEQAVGQVELPDSEIMLRKLKDKKTILHLTCMSGSIELLDWVLNWVKKEIENESDWVLNGVKKEIEDESDWVLKGVKKEIENGSDELVNFVMAEDNDQVTPLWIACQKGNLDMFEKLLGVAMKLEEAKRKAAISETSEHHWAPKQQKQAATALSAQQQASSEQKSTLQKKASSKLLSTKVNSIRRTASTSSAGSLSTQNIRKELLSCKHADGRTCLHVASENGHLPVVKKLCDLSGFDSLFEENDTGETCFTSACRNGHFTIAKFLYEKSIEVGGKDGGKRFLEEKTTAQRTCLHLACEKGNQDLIDFLLDKAGHLLLVQDEQGKTPLWIACEKGDQAAVAKLLRRGNTTSRLIGMTDTNGGTLLHAASKLGKIDILKMICENFNKDAEKLLLEKDFSGATAFHKAIEKGVPQDNGACTGHEKCAELLLRISEKTGKAKDMLEMKLKDDKTCLHLASGSGNIKFVSFLLDKRSKKKSPADDYLWEGAGDFLWDRVSQENERKKEILLEKDNRGATCFSSACEMGRKDCAEWLLKQFAELGTFRDKNHNRDQSIYKTILDMKLNDGSTCMHLACGSGDLALVKTLETKLRCYKKEEELLKLYLSADTKGKTCFSWACERGRLDCVKYLWNHLQQLSLSVDKDHTASTFQGAMKVKDLELACNSGNEELVVYIKKLLEGDKTTKMNEQDIRSLFKTACAEGRLKVVQLFSKSDQQTKGTCEEIFQDGFLLSETGRLDFLYQCLELASRADSGTNEEEEAFYRREHSEVVKHLLDNVHEIEGKLCNTPSKSNQDSGAQRRETLVTCFRAACEKGSIQCARALFTELDAAAKAAGETDKKTRVTALVEAEESAKSQNGKTCLHLVCQSGKVDLFNFLWGKEWKDKVHKTDKNGATPLWYACEKGPLAMVERLYEVIEEGSQHNPKDTIKHEELDDKFIASNKDASTCLHIASEKGHSDIVEFLCEKKGWGHTLFDQDKNGAKCFHSACKGGHYKCATYLYDMAAQMHGEQHTKENYIMLKLEDGRTCIHLACESGDKNLLTFVLDKISEHLTFVGLAPPVPFVGLHNAMEAFAPKIRELLPNLNPLSPLALELLKTKNNEGKTCLHVLCERDDLELFELLMKRLANVAEYKKERQGWELLMTRVGVSDYQEKVALSNISIVDEGVTCLDLVPADCDPEKWAINKEKCAINKEKWDKKKEKWAINKEKWDKYKSLRGEFRSQKAVV